MQEVKVEKERLDRERKLKQKQKAKDRVRSEKEKLAAEKEAAEKEARERTEEAAAPAGTAVSCCQVSVHFMAKHGCQHNAGYSMCRLYSRQAEANSVFLCKHL